MCMAALPIYKHIYKNMIFLYTTYMSNGHQSQVCDSLEVELEMVVDYHVDARNWESNLVSLEEQLRHLPCSH